MEQRGGVYYNSSGRSTQGRKYQTRMTRQSWISSHSPLPAIVGITDDEYTHQFRQCQVKLSAFPEQADLLDYADWFIVRYIGISPEMIQDEISSTEAPSEHVAGLAQARLQHVRELRYRTPQHRQARFNDQ